MRAGGQTRRAHARDSLARAHEITLRDERRVEMEVRRDGALAVIADSSGGIYYSGAAEGTDASVIVGKVDATGHAVTYPGAIPVTDSNSTFGHAIALGCKRLSLGRTALEPKARLGARPDPMRVWIRHRIPMLNLIVRGLLHTIDDHEEAPQRNPFK
jgi:hypothetical protein